MAAAGVLPDQHLIHRPRPPRALAGLVCLALAIALAEAVAAAEYRLGGDDGNPWRDALSLSGAGSYVAVDEGQPARRVPVGTTPFGAGIDTLIDYAGNAIRPRHVDPGTNLVLTDPASDPKKIPLPVTGGQVQTNARCIQIGQDQLVVKSMFDGNPATAMFRAFGQDLDRPPGYGSGWGDLDEPRSVIVDFGAAIPVNRIRFYPRLGRADDRLLIDEIAEPRPALDAFGQDSFSENYLPWYEIRLGDNTPRFRAAQCDAVGQALGLPWVAPSDPQLQVLKETRENLDVVVDLRFPTQSVRWINLRPFPLRDWEIAEMEVYGEGFVNETVLVTQILDFGEPVTWGRIRWRGQTPPQTRVEIRTRTGSTPDPNLYLAESTNGDLEPISREDYYQIDVSGRLAPGYDTESWSFWSPPYAFAEGLRDEDLPAGAWLDGTPVLSPGPRRYLQLSIRFFATFTAAPHLEQLALQLADAPAAQEVVGEVWPIETTSFAPTTFTYVVRPRFEATDRGFDALEIFVPGGVDSVHSVTVDDEALDLAVYRPEVAADRLIAHLPLLSGELDSFKRIQVIFDATVLRFGTEFLGWVYASADASGVKQRIDPGNATFRFSGDVLSVRTPLGGALLQQVAALPGSITPNGDGVNETLTVSYKVREVVLGRPVSLQILDLSGRLVYRFPELVSRSGSFRREWDGRDESGRLVPPGTYLCELRLEAQAEERFVRAFAVVY